MIKSSKLIRRVWIIAISVVAITLMSVAMSFASEAKETSVDNPQAKEEAIVNEKPNADVKVSDKESNAPLHINLKVSDASVPMQCSHE